ncbi:MAG: hypothetical protein IT285_07510 [Bdellovibrionales bacterium]|nr:hypothetical protein [Bdellovibrionales bacterium]
MIHLPRLLKGLRPLGALMLGLVFMGSHCDPGPDQPDLGDLADGKAVRGNVDTECAESEVLDAFGELCTLIVGSTCLDQSSSCNSYARQIFMGTRMNSTEKPGAHWNGMGGSGELMADAVMCSLKELSSSKAGAQKATVSVDVGIGTVSATQEIGFLGWTRVNPEFWGYRKLKLELPILGKIDVVTQDLHVAKRSFALVRYSDEFAPPLAGSHPITAGYGLDVHTQEKLQSMTLKPPSFSVPTPIGAFNVQPSFSYAANTTVVDSPYDGNSIQDLQDFYGSPGATVRLTDLFGFNPGVNASDNLVTFNTMQDHQKGWSSQLGLGNRDPRTEPEIWTPPSSGPVVRRDLDLSVARSADEAMPSLEVSASARLKYPENPADLLPSWVNSLSFLSATDAYIWVEPKLRAGVSDQFNIGSSEGAHHHVSGEFDFGSNRFASTAMWGGVTVAGGFSITAGLRLYIALDLPFWGTKKIVDISPKWPVIFPEVTASAQQRTVGGYSTGQQWPPTLHALNTFQQTLTTPAAVADYVQQCYAPGSDVDPEPAPEPEATPGNPSDLFPDDQLWPCNICVFVAEFDDPAHGISIEEQSSYVLPSVGAPTFLCNRELKNGCMDWCSWDKETNELHVAVPASAMGTLVQGTDNTYPFDLERPWLNIRYEGCATP